MEQCIYGIYIEQRFSFSNRSCITKTTKKPRMHYNLQFVLLLHDVFLLVEVLTITPRPRNFFPDLEI